MAFASPACAPELVTLLMHQSWGARAGHILPLESITLHSMNTVPGRPS